MNPYSVRILVPTLLAVALAGCANLNSISRTNDLAIVNEGGKKGSGKAIHLDIQQRLLIIDELGNFCAEPSPDALAAFAGAVGASASNPAKAAVAASFAGSSTAASVGLRTQTITIMRDALFRMCEAYANGAVGAAQVAALLNRSQDLTAVVLAVEQLTGVTAAKQAALDSQTDADATASLQASSGLVQTLSQRVERQNARLEEATKRKSRADAELRAAEDAVTAANSKLATAQSKDNATEIEAAKNELARVTGCMSVITSPSSEIGDDARVFCQELVRTVVLTKTLESEQRASVVAQEIARKKALRLDANLSDIDLIIRCVGTGGALDANKVERIFDAANANGKLSNSRPFVVRAENETQLRSVLSRLSDVRSPMAAVIRTNPALCPN